MAPMWAWLSHLILPRGFIGMSLEMAFDRQIGLDSERLGVPGWWV